MQSKEIAVCIERKKPTVEQHIRLLFAKCGAKTRAQLVAIAIERGAVNVRLTSTG